MAYYGAQVIHPKTIKPLQNKGIPLHVKCFLDPSLNGTIISKKQIKHLPPVRYHQGKPGADAFAQPGFFFCRRKANERII
jgi:aspartokinase